MAASRYRIPTIHHPSWDLYALQILNRLDRQVLTVGLPRGPLQIFNIVWFHNVLRCIIVHKLLLQCVTLSLLVIILEDGLSSKKHPISAH